MRKLIAIIIIFQFSCSTPVDKTQDQNVQALPDSLFPLKNISKTEIPDDLKLKYHDLDSSEKMAYVAPIFLKDKSHSIDLDYFIHWQTARFISKQNKIEDFTPIIVSIGGDDFDAIYYILLDKTNKPVSGFQIGGSGICGGPEEVSDSLLRVCPIRRSYLDNDIISTNILTMTFQPDSVKHPTFFDSVTYISKVLPTGIIETKLLDSIRTQRMFY